MMIEGSNLAVVKFPAVFISTCFLSIPTLKLLWFNLISISKRFYSQDMAGSMTYNPIYLLVYSIAVFRHTQKYFT